MDATLKDVFLDIGFFFKINNSKQENNRTEVDLSCNIATHDDVEKFISSYMKHTNETIKIRTRKKCTEKGIYSHWASYRCHHDTRHEKTRDSKAVLAKKPMKRFKNTFCPFQMTIKIHKLCPNENEKCCVFIEHDHNHPVESLHALSFKEISTETANSINSLFDSGMSASQAYMEFIQNFRISCNDDLDFHLKKADRSNCPRRMDFNALYRRYCEELFGGRNGPEMFSKLEEKINDLRRKEDDLKISYKLYDKENGSSLIIAIVTPLMVRVHSMVSLNFVIRLFLYFCEDFVTRSPSSIAIVLKTKLRFLTIRTIIRGNLTFIVLN